MPLKIFYCESDSNNIVVIIDMLYDKLKLYFDRYCYSNNPWCERALVKNTQM